MSFEPFLNIAIDNEEKRSVWLKLVEVLDEINENEEFFSGNTYFNKYENEVISEEDKSRYLSGIEKLINYDEIYIEERIQMIVERYLLQKEDEKEREEINEFASFSKDYSKTFGHLHIKFSQYLSILNEDYKKYIENMGKLTAEVNKRMKEKTGMDTNEFFEKYIIEK